MFDPVADKGMMRHEYAKADLTTMMIAIIDNGGMLAGQDPKSDKGGDQD
jgi:hypothetical protein